MSTHRIDNKAYEKQIRFFAMYAAIAAILAVCWLTLSWFGHTGHFSWFDASVFIFPLLMYFELWRRRRELKGQFVELDQSTLSFKGHQKEATVISLASISAINIHLHTIDIITQSGETHTLDIRDFQGYAHRKQVKELFRELRSGLANSGELKLV